MEYKPILVIYYPQNIDESDREHMMSTLLQVEVQTGYHVLSISTSGEPRAEIISVDKATVVEDIQKYIDLKIKENEKPNK